ncbi:MAG: helix-turn-helix domain-containing protein, partial [Streptosporangiaceae bacterium]
MSQPGVARFEAGGTTPTLPLLERLAEALGLTLTVTLGSAQRRPDDGDRGHLRVPADRGG